MSREKTGIIFGYWTSPKYLGKCLKCGGEMILCPREGHLNSKFWKLERNDGLILVVCPNNCLENAPNKYTYKSMNCG